MLQQEKIMESRTLTMKKDAEKLYEKHRKHMDVLDKSVLAKVRGSLSFYDYWALGKQLEQYESYIELAEEAGNTNLLGKLPQVAMDVNNRVAA